MTIKNTHFNRKDILQDAGLLKCPKCYRDYKFLSALVVGALVLWLIQDVVPVFKSEQVLTITVLFSLIVWQPVIEEILFRGVLQGQLLKYKWAQHTVIGITMGNVVVSILFVSVHLVNVTAVWSLLVFFPSIVFGYLRDTYRSVYPSIIAHMSYNVFVVVGLYINGNAVFDFGVL